MKKILLITDMPPCRHYTAGIILRQFIDFLQPAEVACFAVTDRALPDAKLDADLGPKVPIRYEYKPNETARRILPSRAGNFVSYLFERYNEHFSVPELAQKILTYAGEIGADSLWFVLQGQTMIRLPKQVRKKSQLPIYVNIWDPPGWWLRDRRIDGKNSRRILADFAEAIQISQKCGTAGLDMAEEYSRLYGGKTVALLPCLPLSHLRTPEPKINEGKDFVITLAGQLYASEEWEALLTALSSVNWTLHGRRVVARVLGRGFSRYTSTACNIEYLGWRNQNETYDWLEKSDVNYCPYWFNPTFETESRLSFPGKLTTYLAAGKPIFFHGPEYASPGKFLARHQAAALCHSLDKDEILRVLSKLITDADYYKSRVQNGVAAFKSELEEQHLRQKVRSFLEVDSV